MNEKDFNKWWAEYKESGEMPPEAELLEQQCGWAMREVVQAAYESGYEQALNDKWNA